MAESVLDRKFVRNLTLEQMLYVTVFILAIVLRTYALGVRPYHHDESIHAFYSWKITESGLGDYRYDPVYHGPVLYYASALSMALLGDNDFTGRFSAVLFGIGVLAFAWPLRRYLGRTGALAFLILLSFSPSFTYFTRFLRHDIYMALATLGFSYSIFRYGETRVARHLYYAGAWLAVAFCTKEDMYAMGPVLIIALLMMLLWEVVHGTRKIGDVTAEIGETLRGAVLPTATAAVIFAIIWLVLYTSFLDKDRLENWNAVSRALSYWWGQHQIKRIGGPWWYYLPQLTLYDPLIFYGAIAVMFGPFVLSNRKDPVLRAMRYAVLAGAAVFLWMAWQEIWGAAELLVLLMGLMMIGVARVWLPDRFTRYAIMWSLGALCFYGWAQEKVPWLLVPQILPLALVASIGLARVIESGAIKQMGTAIPLSAVGALTIWTLIASNFLYDAPIPDEDAGAAKPKRHAELLAYVQSTYDISKVMQRIEDAANKLQTGTETRLAVSGEATWPFSWYLRHYPVNWAANVRNIDTPVVIVDKNVTKSVQTALQENYEEVPFAIRGWWEPNWRLATLPNVMRFLITREAWNPVGSSDAVAFIHKNLAPGMTFAKIAVDPPPAARSYPEDPSILPAVAMWGTKGTAQGQFDEPRGLAVDAKGNLFVVDSKNNRIQKLSPEGKVLAAWGGPGDGAGEFKDPCGIAVGPDGSVYVADTWNHRVQKFDPDGSFLLQWTAEPSFWGPRGIAVGKDGTVYVTDTGNKRVLAYNSEGEEKAKWGTEGSKPAHFIEPVGIAVNDQGQVIVADTGNRRLQVFTADGTFVKEIPMYGWEEFYSEPYIAVRGDDIYVTDSYNNRFSRYNDGKVDGSWGKAGSASGDFNRPIGIAVDGSGTVYVSDTMNNRIEKFIPPPD